MRTVWALWKREMIKFVRDLSRVGGAVLQPLVVWFLLGFGFQESFRLPGAAKVPYLEFLFPGIIALIALFTSIFSTISIVEERKSGFLQAALAAPVARSSIVLGTTLGGTSLALIQTVLFAAMLPAVGPTPSISGFVLLLVVTAFIGIAFTCLGICMAWKTRTTRGFHAVMNLFLVPLWALSGAFFPLSGTPAALGWIIRLNPVSYGVDALRHAIYLPAGPPVSLADLSVSLGITAAFALVMFAVAVRVVRKGAG